MKLLLLFGAALALLLIAGFIAGRLTVWRMEARFSACRCIRRDGWSAHPYPRQGRPIRCAEATLVAIHGASCSGREMMFAFEGKLDAFSRLIAIDRPGHGYSERRDLAAMPILACKRGSSPMG